MTPMTKVTKDNSMVDIVIVKVLSQPWQPLVNGMWPPKWWPINNPDDPEDDWRLPCNYHFDELVMTLENLMMTSDNIWWPWLATVIAKIESCLSCWYSQHRYFTHTQTFSLYGCGTWTNTKIILKEKAGFYMEVSHSNYGLREHLKYVKGHLDNE